MKPLWQQLWTFFLLFFPMNNFNTRLYHYRAQWVCLMLQRNQTTHETFEWMLYSLVCKNHKGLFYDKYTYSPNITDNDYCGQHSDSACNTCIPAKCYGDDRNITGFRAPLRCYGRESNVTLVHPKP